MEKKYTVMFVMDNTYEVLEKKYDSCEDNYFYEKVYQGSISDCEAYIRLKEGGYF